MADPVSDYIGDTSEDSKILNLIMRTQMRRRLHEQQQQRQYGIDQRTEAREQRGERREEREIEREQHRLQREAERDYDQAQKYYSGQVDKYQALKSKREEQRTKAQRELGSLRGTYAARAKGNMRVEEAYDALARAWDTAYPTGKALPMGAVESFLVDPKHKAMLIVAQKLKINPQSFLDNYSIANNRVHIVDQWKQQGYDDMAGLKDKLDNAIAEAERMKGQALNPIQQAEWAQALTFLKSMRPEKFAAFHAQSVGQSGGQQQIPPMTLGTAGGQKVTLQDPGSFAGTFSSGKQGTLAVPTYGAAPADVTSIEAFNRAPNRHLAATSQQQLAMQLLDLLRDQAQGEQQASTDRPSGGPQTGAAHPGGAKVVQAGKAAPGGTGAAQWDAPNDFSIPSWRTWVQKHSPEVIARNIEHVKKGIMQHFKGPERTMAWRIVQIHLGVKDQ